MEVFNFKEQLKDALDDAVTVVLNSKDYDQGLDMGVAILEEVMAEEVARIVTTPLMGMINDLSKLERQILADLEEFRDRKKRRDEHIAKQLDTDAKIMSRAYKHLEERGKDAGQEH